MEVVIVKWPPLQAVSPYIIIWIEPRINCLLSTCWKRGSKSLCASEQSNQDKQIHYIIWGSGVSSNEASRRHKRSLTCAVYIMTDNPFLQDGATLRFETWPCIVPHTSCLLSRDFRMTRDIPLLMNINYTYIDGTHFLQDNMHQAETQIHAGWSESSLSAWRRFGYFALNLVYPYRLSWEDSDQIAQMQRPGNLLCAHAPKFLLVHTM